MATATKSEPVIANVVNEREIPAGTGCQEAARQSSGSYVPCNAPATSIVFSPRDRRSYYMCDVCASHAVNNRGFELRFATARLESTTELQTSDASATLAIDFEATKEQLTMLVTTSGMLTVKDINDKAGIERVRERRLELKGIRVRIENRRKELKAESLEFGRKVDGVAKELTAIIEPEEKRLQHEEDVVKRHEAKLAEEKAQREKEAAERKLLVTRERCQQLALCGGKPYLACDVGDLSDDDFSHLLAAEQKDQRERDAKAAKDEAERKRVDEQNRLESERLEKERAEFECRKRDAETRFKCAQVRSEMLATLGHVHQMTADQLADMTADHWEDVLSTARLKKQQRDDEVAAEKARLDKQREDQAEAQAKIDAENKRIADEEAERQRRAEIAKAQEEAAELARQEAAAEQERLAAEAKAKAEAEEAELRRLESLRPDHEKLLTVAATVEAIAVPPVSVSAGTAASEIETLLADCAVAVREVANGLVRAGEAA